MLDVLKRLQQETAETEDVLTEAAVRERLDKLEDEGLLEFFALSGPEQGSEQEDEEQRSAAEMVYENLIEGTHVHTADNEDTPDSLSTAQTLSRTAHIQIPAANGNPTQNGGTPPHRQTTSETLGTFADSLRPRPDSADLS